MLTVAEESSTIKVLLLLVPDRIGTSLDSGRRLRSTPAAPLPPPVGVALLPQNFKNQRPDICNLFRRRGLPVANTVADLTQLDLPATDPRLDMLELSLDARSASTDPLTLFNILGDNRQLVRLLLSPTSVQYRRLCCSYKYCGSLYHWTTCQGRSFLDRDNFRILRYLIMLRVELTHRDPTCGTLLHLAAKRGYERIAKCILPPYNLDPNAQDLNGRTPLFWALEKQHGGVRNLLFALGADINHRDRNGQTVLHVMMSLRYRTASFLIAYNADPNVADNQGQTPLILAALDGSVENARSLLDAGARIDAVANDGTTAFHAALCGRHYNLFRFLLEYNIWHILTALRMEVGLLLNPLNVPNVRFLRRAAKFLQDHLVKVLTLLQDYHFSFDFLDFLGDVSDLRARCSAEAAALRAEQVCPGVSLFDVMTMDMGRLVGLLRNGAVARRVRNTDRERFPVYGNMLKYSFNRGIYRKRLLRQGVNACHVLIPRFRALPLEVWFVVVSHLSNRELHYLSFQTHHSISPLRGGTVPRNPAVRHSHGFPTEEDWIRYHISTAD